MSLSQPTGSCTNNCLLRYAKTRFRGCWNLEWKSSRVRLKIPSDSQIHNQTFLSQIFHFSSTIPVILFIFRCSIYLPTHTQPPDESILFPEEFHPTNFQFIFDSHKRRPKVSKSTFASLKLTPRNLADPKRK